MTGYSIKTNQIIILLGLICIIPCTNLVAQNKPGQIDQLLQSYHNLHEFDGTVLVAKQGKIIFEKGYGLANAAWNIPNDVDTKFNIASLTKQFTGMLIMQLKQGGKLRLRDPVSKFLPWYRKDVGDKVTIFDLLTHTSGIPDYTDNPHFFDDIALHNYSPREFVEKFCSDSLMYQPGTKYNYCNAEYYILGAVIEAVTHKTYRVVLQQQIFDVIGMKNSGVDLPGEIVKNKAAGYNFNYGSYTNADYINIYATIFAAGGMYSTVTDLLLWNNALYGEKLLLAANKDTMFTPFLQKYAFGITVNKTDVPGIKGSLTFMTHTGGINGFRSVILREVENKEVIILLSNTVLNNNFGIDLNPISNKIFSILHGLPYKSPLPSVGSVLGEKLYQDTSINPMSFFHQIKAAGENKYDFTYEESQLNSLGYFLLSRLRIKDAIAIFKLNTEEFPHSWNAFDSYAEALMTDGQKELAVKNYKYSLELNPGNTNATEQIKMLMQNKP